MDRLLQNVQYLKGVGPQRSKLLAKMNIHSIFDLLWHFPRTYIDRSVLQPTHQLVTGDQAAIIGTVLTTRSSRSRRGMTIISAAIESQGITIQAVWFNQPFMTDILKNGRKIWLSGKVRNVLPPEIHVSEYEMLESEESVPGIVPVYHTTEGISQKMWRSLLERVLKTYLGDYPEILDQSQRQHYELCTIQEALANIHFPTEGSAYQQARRRLAFEELLLFQLRLRSLAVEDNKLTGLVHKEKDDLVQKIRGGLSYQLTPAQERVIAEIFNDMESPWIMNRLLQGDVGAGKTVVAALAMVKAVSSGYQAAFMVPTEILALQHGQALTNILYGSGVKLELLTGSTSAAERSRILELTHRGEIDILVGTHALIQEGVAFKKLGLAVIDEQHRFGVRQRAALLAKGDHPDTLIMTATPIPRTLALTAYGNLEMSVIDQLPPGRIPVKTKSLPYKARLQAYNFVKQEIIKGRQAYVVCPLVEESENVDLQAAVNLHDELRTGIFKEYEIGLLHGRLRSDEKEEIMNRFKVGDIKVLVTTTVVEVGVDIANASVMLIEHAERFGLSQLHQLRGRVGRSDLQSYCILLADPHTEESRQRLRAMETSNDGFYLAQQDLIIRGPGDFWGVRQHGLDQLKIADLTKDLQLAEKARQCSREIDPLSLRKYVHARFPMVEGTAMN
jgi:ATP-dependent DNA helicase RecG